MTRVILILLTNNESQVEGLKQCSLLFDIYSFVNFIFNPNMIIRSLEI